MLETKQWTVLEESDYSNAVSKHFGVPYSMQQRMLLGQDSIFPLQVGEETERNDALLEEHAEKFEAWIARGNEEPEGYWAKQTWQMDMKRGYPDINAEIIAYAMAKAGHLEFGKTYHLHIWW